MRRIVPAMLAGVMVFLAGNALPVNGQAACSFEQGFAELRALVGEHTVGTCIENEHVNPDNGNTEQRTTGGLLVWRKADNFTAFTDGGTTWINGPNGLESRPNDQRLAWEQDPAAQSAAPPTRTPRPIPTLPPRPPGYAAPVAPPIVSGAPVTGGSGSIESPQYTAQGGSTVTAGPPPPPGNPAGSSPPTAPGAGASTTAPPPPPPPGAAASAAAGDPARVAAAGTPTPTPTKTPTPKPSLTVEFEEKPDEVDTGSDAYFEVQTSAKKGSCALHITYNDSSEVNMGGKHIDKDGRCDWKFTLPADANTGKAKARVTVAAEGKEAETDETFSVKKGDTIYAGSVDLEVEPTDLPDDVEPGDEIKIGIDTNLKRKGSCDLLMTWPKIGAVASPSQMPDGSGRCSWKVTVPLDVPRDASANLYITVRKDGSTVRTLTKDFEIEK